MKAELAKSGIPYKRIEVYGAQIVITAWSEDAARKWWSLISRFATMRGSVLHSHEDTIDEGPYYKAHPGILRNGITHDVWRVYAHV